MATTYVKTAEIINRVELSEIPDGEYNGIWSGYEVTATMFDEQYRFRTEDGVRALRAECRIIVKSGVIRIVTTDKEALATKTIQYV